MEIKSQTVHLEARMWTSVTTRHKPECIITWKICNHWYITLFSYIHLLICNIVPDFHIQQICRCTYACIRKTIWLYVHASGCSINSGLTIPSNSSGVKKPSVTVASFSVVPSLWAFFAHLATSIHGVICTQCFTITQHNTYCRNLDDYWG